MRERGEPGAGDTFGPVDSSDARIDELVAALGSKNGLARQSARKALQKIGTPAVPALLVALTSRHERVRWEAAKALGEIADPRAADGLAVALDDKSAGVRWLAAEGLARLGRAGLIAVFNVLIVHSYSAWLRESAHHVLTLLEYGELSAYVIPVIQALEDVEPNVQAPLAAKDSLDKLQREQP